MTTKKKQAADDIKFGDAIDELEGILKRVEGEEIDIDELANELKNASELLEVCRGKIRKAELEVTQIVQSLEEANETSDPSDEDE